MAELRNRQGARAGRVAGTPERVQDPEAARIIRELQDQIAELQRAIPQTPAPVLDHGNLATLTRVDTRTTARGLVLRIYERRATYQDGRLVTTTAEQVAQEIIVPVTSRTTVVEGGGSDGEEDEDPNTFIVPTGWVIAGS